MGRGVCCHRAIPAALDPHQAAKVTPATFKRYQKVLKDFVDWLDETDENPDCAEQVDDLLVAYKQDQMISKSTLENLVAAVGFCWPRFRGRLSWGNAVLAGWAVSLTLLATLCLCPSRWPAWWPHT